jgi:small subunit ribosomal protein S2
MGIQLENTQDNIFKEMLEAGVYYGHKKTKTHPRMKPYIFSTRNSIELINLEATLVFLAQAKDFLKEKISQGATILMVATQPAAQKIIEDFAQKYNFPYMTERWLGGTLTNFKVINQRVAYYLDLKKKKEQGELDKYTKKEQLKINKELTKMGKAFSGLINLNKLPDILFVIDTIEHRTAVREAHRLNIPIVAVMSTDCDPKAAEYPIVANDHSKTSVEWIMKYLEPAFVRSIIKDEY